LRRESVQMQPYPVTARSGLVTAKSIRVGPDRKLYVPIGAPCDIWEPSDQHAKIIRMDLDGTNVETVAIGVRHTLGFDWDPKSHELWFTDNQRDWLSEDLPNDELNHKIGQHFGFPYCHQGDIADSEFGWAKDCSNYIKPAALLVPHSAPLGMRFYTGRMFPKQYHGAIFIARHGPWNRTKKYAADVVVAWPDGKGSVSKVEPFLTGLVEDNEYIGRPVDLLILKDGSLQVMTSTAQSIVSEYGRTEMMRLAAVVIYLFQCGDLQFDAEALKALPVCQHGDGMRFCGLPLGGFGCALTPDRIDFVLDPASACLNGSGMSCLICRSVR
jgi:glucose/arabinose dehydrogenase